jgi:hypothetical protein
LSTINVDQTLEIRDQSLVEWADLRSTLLATSISSHERQLLKRSSASRNSSSKGDLNHDVVDAFQECSLALQSSPDVLHDWLWSRRLDAALVVEERTASRRAWIVLAVCICLGLAGVFILIKVNQTLEMLETSLQTILTRDSLVGMMARTLYSLKALTLSGFTPAILSMLFLSWLASRLLLGANFAESLLLNLPVIGRNAKDRTCLSFFTLSSALMRTGLSPRNALSLANRTLASPFARAWTSVVVAKLERNETLSSSLRQNVMFECWIPEVAQVIEQSGASHIPDALQLIVETLRDEIQTRSKLVTIWLGRLQLTMALLLAIAIIGFSIFVVVAIRDFTGMLLY